MKTFQKLKWHVECLTKLFATLQSSKMCHENIFHALFVYINPIFIFFFFSQIANFFFSPQKVENLSNKLGDSLKRMSSRFIAFEILKNMSYHIDDKYLDVVWVVFLLMWNNQVKWFSSLDNAVSVWKIIMNHLIIVSYYCIILFLLPLHCVGHINNGKK